MQQLRLERANLGKGAASNKAGATAAATDPPVARSGWDVTATFQQGQESWSHSTMGKWLSSASGEEQTEEKKKVETQDGMTQAEWELAFITSLFDRLQITGSLRVEVEQRCRAQHGSTAALAETLIDRARETPEIVAQHRSQKESSDLAERERQRKLWFSDDSPSSSPAGAAAEANAARAAEDAARDAPAQDAAAVSGNSESASGQEASVEGASVASADVVVAVEEDVGVATVVAAADELLISQEQTRSSAINASTHSKPTSDSTDSKKESTSRNVAGEGDVSEEEVVEIVRETEEEKADRIKVEAEAEDALVRKVGGIEWTVCWLLLATAVQSARYDARARGALRRVCRALGVPWQWLSAAEVLLCAEIVKRALEVAQEAAKAAAATAAAEGKPQSVGKYQRWGYIGGGALLGGVVFAVSGGLAVPAVVAGMGLCGAAVGAHVAIGAGTMTGLTAVVGVSFGGYGAGLVGKRVAHRIGDIEEFELDIVDMSMGLPITIGVPGWLNDSQDSPWKVWDEPLCSGVSDGGDALAVKFLNSQNTCRLAKENGCRDDL